ncbi:MAG: hypothetical protein R2830_17765 [Saprospiraceae bacterium]
MKTEPNEFYIGWQPEAPMGISRRVRQFIFAVCVAVPLIGILLVLNQSGFTTSTFEFGQPSELEGVLTQTPAPFLQVYRGKDVEGKPVFQNILLVAPGKHGIGEMLAASERQLGHSLNGKMVKLSGILIYHDGKTLMEVEEMADLVEEGTANEQPPAPTAMGNGAITGEITDPKCLFGVMKPGYGKPHRSCAARCIAGGIPPVLKTLSTDGQVQYYLLAGENGEAINDEVLPFVGDQVVACGSVRKVGDWLVLFKDGSKDLALVPKGLDAAIPTCGF